jgi:glycosyltransferase involved in cell wall biosynthesis
MTGTDLETPRPRDRRRGLVIAWMATSQRSTSLARRLDFDLLLLGRMGFRRPWTAPFGYIALLVRTTREILLRRPRALLVVTPPIVAPLFALPIARLTGARVGIDIHSGAFLDRRWRWSLPILRLLGTCARANIVTLPSLAQQMGRAADRTIVLPDPLPTFPEQPSPDSIARSPADARPTVAVIAGWGDDEPLAELGEAALGQPWTLLITGKPRRRLDLPPNASLTGFLEEAAYVSTLRNADVLVVLTTRPETLLSGAWEGIALGKSLVLSETAALRETFGDSVTYAEPSAESIRAAVSDALARRHELEAKAGSFADRFETETRSRVSQLLSALSPGHVS